MTDNKNDDVKQKASPKRKRAFSYLRWSTDPQFWGDSERRRIEMANNYCADHGLQLVDRFTDTGVSAVKGANRKGELGKLLDVIKQGDTLLVEDSARRLTNRFSHQPPRRAVDRLWKLENHRCRPRPAPAAVAELGR